MKLIPSSSDGAGHPLTFKLPTRASILLSVAGVLVSVFVFACAWEFRLEAIVATFLRLPYDVVREAQDDWRYVCTSTAFVALALIVPTIVMLRNVRLLRRSLAAVTQAQRAALAASEAKTRFLANMSHELRTPLNAIIGFSELTMNKLFGPLNARYQEYAGDIHRSGIHLLAIINDVLDLSKSETQQLTLDIAEFRLADKVAAVERMLSPLCAANGVALRVALAAGLPPVRADAMRLKQVLLNLLSNAIKFTDPGGEVVLSARLRPGFVEIAVRDSGIGIASEDLARVFEPFFQVDSSLSRKHDGTGLGLPIALRLVEMMGGKLTLHSVLGEGTTATILIPAAEPVRAAA